MYNEYDWILDAARIRYINFYLIRLHNSSKGKYSIAHQNNQRQQR